jgi:hypothetical protein
MLGKSEIHIAKKCFDLNVKFSFNLIMSITLHRIYRMGVCIRIVHNSSQTPEKNEMALFSCAEILCKRKIEDATQQQPTSLCTPEATSFLLITMPAETLYNKNNKCVCSVRSGMCLSMSITFPSSKYLCGVISLSRRYTIFLVARGGEDLGHDPVGGIIGKTSSRFQRYFFYLLRLFKLNRRCRSSKFFGK